MSKFIVNDRVMTPHGPGTIVGFETFDPGTGRCQALTAYTVDSRAAVKLDNPEAWAGSVPTPCYQTGRGLPHYWHHELKSLRRPTQG